MPAAAHPPLPLYLHPSLLWCHDYRHHSIYRDRNYRDRHCSALLRARSKQTRPTRITPPPTLDPNIPQRNTLAILPRSDRDQPTCNASGSLSIPSPRWLEKTMTVRDLINELRLIITLVAVSLVAGGWWWWIPIAVVAGATTYRPDALWHACPRRTLWTLTCILGAGWYAWGTSAGNSTVLSLWCLYGAITWGGALVSIRSGRSPGHIMRCATIGSVAVAPMVCTDWLSASLLIASMTGCLVCLDEGLARLKENTPPRAFVCHRTR